MSFSDVSKVFITTFLALNNELHNRPLDLIRLFVMSVKNPSTI